MTAMDSAAPSSWAAAYVGQPYILGLGECAQRAAAVWRERFGVEVEVSPAHGDLRRAQRIIKAKLAQSEWQQADAPREGDAVLMRKGRVLCHVGVWVEPQHVLHCTRADGTVLTPVGDLPDQGFQVAGYYRRSAEEALAA